MEEPGSLNNSLQVDNSKTNLIVNYLPQKLSEQELYCLFLPFGEIQTARVVKDRNTGYSYGYGFVNYKNEDDALKAIQNLDGMEIDGKRLKVSYARPKCEDLKDTNLYVTNLPRNFNREDLHEMFSPYGNIVQSTLLHDKFTGMPRGVAFVRYNKKEEAKCAMTALKGKKMAGCMEPIYIKIAEEHGKQKAAYFAGIQYAFTLKGNNQPNNGRNFNGGNRGRGGMRFNSRFNPVGKGLPQWC